MKQLEKEEKDEENYSVAEWWEVESDYQPTECGNDGSGHLIPERLSAGSSKRQSNNIHNGPRHDPSNEQY
jgi:hypothetical protein